MTQAPPEDYLGPRLAPGHPITLAFVHQLRCGNLAQGPPASRTWFEDEPVVPVQVVYSVLLQVRRPSKGLTCTPQAEQSLRGLPSALQEVTARETFTYLFG